MRQQTRSSQRADYRETILNLLISDDLLLRAIVYPDTAELTEDRGPINPVDLIYKNLFPYKKNLQLVGTDEIFITSSISGDGLVANNFKNFALTFFTFVPNSKEFVIYEGRRMLRMDFLAWRLETLFNQSREFGIGTLNYNAFRPVAVDSELYTAEALFYSTLDFN
jgi:hypothetical protein